MKMAPAVMAWIQSNLSQPTTFNSFFGPVTLQPGHNPEVNDKLWSNLKKNSTDVQTLLEKGVLIEISS